MAIRAALPEDIPAVVEVQRQSALLSLSHIFPQDHHPFPGELVGARWHAELEDPSTAVYVCGEDEVEVEVRRRSRRQAGWVVRGFRGTTDTAPAPTYCLETA